MTARSAPTSVAAVDLGASSGRVAVGTVGRGRVELTEVHRFANVPVLVLTTLHWDVLRLYEAVIFGLRAAGRRFELASVGIDSWGVDYGLIDRAGALLGNPVHYRDRRTAGAVEQVLAKVCPQRLYATTGAAQRAINTVCQLTAAAGSPQLQAAATLLLIPDLLAYWITGEIGAEVTNASTTQLYDIRARGWATALMEQLGIPPRIFPPLRQPGEEIGPLLPAVRADAELPGRVPLVAVGSHDTASAVAAAPARGRRFAYISCGTWSLVGVELDRPVLTDASRMASFTNEQGVDGTIRYLRNIVGLWLLQESIRTWERAGRPADLRTLLKQAARVPPLAAVVDPDDPAFLPPGDMPARIAAQCRRTGQRPTRGAAETVRCILDSLALAYRRTLHQVQELSGHDVDVVHIVGGGARNELLCQLTADACGIPVEAGPAEATALGNILVQARSLRAGPGDLDGMRALLRDTQPVRRFDPAGDGAAWQAAAGRIASG